MRITILAVPLLSLVIGVGYSQEAEYDLPLGVGVFEQQVHRTYTKEQGLPSGDVSRIGSDANGAMVAITAHGAAVFDGAQRDRRGRRRG